MHGRHFCARTCLVSFDGKRSSEVRTHLCASHDAWDTAMRCYVECA